MARKMSCKTLMTKAWESYQATRSLLREIDDEPVDPIERIEWLVESFKPVYKTLSLAIEDFSNEVRFSWHRDERKRGWDNETAEIVVSWGEVIHIPIPFRFLQSEGLHTKARKKMEGTKLDFQTIEATEARRNEAKPLACISNGWQRLSIGSQMPEALEALPETTRPHPLAVRAVLMYNACVLTPYIFKWVIVPVWEMGTDSLEQLHVVMEEVLDGKLSLPEGDIVTLEAREYYLHEAGKRREKREHDAKQVVLATHNWNGYSSCTVIAAQSRKEAIRRAIATVNAIRRSDSGGKLDKQLAPVTSLFDDGERILIHIQAGFDFYGMRVNHTYIYFDSAADVEDDFDEANYENYEVHILSMTNGELHSLDT